MRKFKQFLTAAAALSLLSSTEPARADPIKDIVLVHGAWVDASGWKPVYEILTKEGFKVTMVRNRKPRSRTMSPQRSEFSTFKTAPRFLSGIAMAARSSPRQASCASLHSWWLPTMPHEPGTFGAVPHRKKPRRTGRRRGFSFPAATGTCVTMGDRVRHTARLECRDERRYQRKPRMMVKTQAALRQGLKAAPDPTHRPHDDVDEEPSNGDGSQG